MLKIFKKTGTFLILWSFNIGEKEYKGNIKYSGRIKTDDDLYKLESFIKRSIANEKKDIIIPNDLVIENIMRLD